MELKEIVSLMKDIENPKSIYGIMIEHSNEISKENLVIIIMAMDYANFNILDNVKNETIKAKFIERVEETIADIEEYNGYLADDFYSNEENETEYIEGEK